MPTPIYLISFNRLTWLQQLAQQCERFPDSQVVIVDNASTYPPLVDWLRNCPYETVRLPDNAGHESVWLSRVVKMEPEQQQRWGTPYYVVADHDLSVADVPADAFDVFREGFRRYPGVLKVGLSLAVDDVHPAWQQRVREQESPFWTTLQPGGYYKACLDTSFVMCHAATPYDRIRHACHEALRTAPPYTAKHLPWYLETNQLTDEDRYYWRMCNLGPGAPARWCDKVGYDANGCPIL